MKTFVVRKRYSMETFTVEAICESYAIHKAAQQHFGYADFDYLEAKEA
ncbi:hypothetical protein [Vibrio coralliilyticus]|nr:hypothetical protein [Vibrio coralliilyticus]